MKIAFLSGAYKNAGDFLIESRCMKLLEYFIEDISIDRFLRNEIAGKCEELNNYDVIAIGGGPIYGRKIERNLPIAEMMGNIKKPLMVIGGGWYGSVGSYESTYNYSFSDLSKQFLHKVDHDGLGLSCRDIYTYRALLKEGFKNVFLTGCPAWYNIDTVSESKVAGTSSEIKTVVISDPAQDKNIEMAIDVARTVRERYPDAKVTFVFHRGLTSTHAIWGKKLTKEDLSESVKKYCDNVIDISHSADGFSAYDNCDLHVGFRVHAHIYCLSMRKRSVLIEEDGRGAGVNQILGLPSLKSYSDDVQIDNRIYNISKNKFGLFPYRHIVEDLNSHLDILKETEDIYFENAFRLQQQYFKAMGQFICRLNSIERKN